MQRICALDAIERAIRANGGSDSRAQCRGRAEVRKLAALTGSRLSSIRLTLTGPARIEAMADGVANRAPGLPTDRPVTESWHRPTA